MLQVLNKIDRAITRFEESAGWIAFAIISVFLFVAVVFRYAFNAPFTWTEELITIIFSWVCFLGASACCASHGLLRVDAFIRLLPVRLQTVAAVLSLAAMIAILGVFIWFGFAYALAVIDDQFPMLGLSFAWAFMSLPVASCFALVHVVTVTLNEGVLRTFMSVTEMDETLAPGVY
jgi:TRAP-type C4-dicarboxylate transport system permease small subunit